MSRMSSNHHHHHPGSSASAVPGTSGMGGMGGRGGSGLGLGPGVVATSLTHPLPDIIDYKVKLLGLLPDGYMYHNGATRWDLSTACFIKIPSEMTCYEGKIDRRGHPTLIGSGILERKYGLTVHLPTLAEAEKAAQVAASQPQPKTRSSGGGRVGDDEDDDRDHNRRGGGLDDDAILEEEEEEDSGDESGSEASAEGGVGGIGRQPSFICQGCQHNAAQNQKDNLMTKWLKNNFDPRRDVLPDIVCRRTVLTYIMTQKQPFILNAKKISFTSSQDPDRREYKVIHVEFDYLPPLDSVDPGGGGGVPGERSRGPSGASKTPDNLPTSEKNFDAESYYEKPNLIGYFAGKLSCKVPTMPPENRSIRILLSAIVDGLWRYKNNPELYTTQDLAEVKSTMDTTVVPDPKKGGNPHFFKQVRMAHAWAQCHLVGINRMMVGVHTLVPGNFADETEQAYALTSKPKRILQELWLYDVDKMPNAVKISSDEDGFRPWSPIDLKWKLYTALQQIRAQVQHSDEGVTHRFLHYFNEDFLVPMTLEELQLEWKAIHEAYRTLIFRNVHLIPTSPDVIELSMEEVEQEHAEKQVDHILNTFLGLGVPIETVKVVRIVGSRKELEVIFPYEALARRVYTTFRLFVYKNRFLPRGFERIRVDVKRTKRQELERMRRKGNANMFYLIQNPGSGTSSSYPPPHPPHHPSCSQCQYGGGSTVGGHHHSGKSSYHGPYHHHQQSHSSASHHHPHSSSHHHPNHPIFSQQQQLRSTQPSPFPTTGRQHHSHHHHHHHTPSNNKHSSFSIAATHLASSASNVPTTVFGSGGRGGSSSTAGGGGVGGGGGNSARDNDPWRYTQTMWH